MDEHGPLLCFDRRGDDFHISIVVYRRLSRFYIPFISQSYSTHWTWVSIHIAVLLSMNHSNHQVTQVIYPSYMNTTHGWLMIFNYILIPLNIPFISQSTAYYAITLILYIHIPVVMFHFIVNSTHVSMHDAEPGHPRRRLHPVSWGGPRVAEGPRVVEVGWISQWIL